MGGSQATEQRERRERVRLGSGVSTGFIALWLLLAGCSSEESSNAPNEEETTASETTSADDTTPTRLTNLGGAVRPTFSPDGQKVAFLNHPEGMEIDRSGARPQGTPELYIMNSDGTDQTHLADQAEGAAFSPDGERIAFTVRDDLVWSRPKTKGPPPWPPLDSEIYVINSDGTDLTNLANDPAPNRGPTWSPDGKKIAFETNSIPASPPLTPRSM